MKLKISLEGLVSLALVQLPAIALGILGILKAFVNNGFSKQAVKDSMRSVSKSGESNFMTFLGLLFSSVFLFVLWNFLVL